MRCAALFGGRPERGAAGLANDVRSSHVLLCDSCDAVESGVPSLCTFFWAVEAETKVRGDDAKPRPTPRSDRFVAILQERGRPKRLVTY